jgi:DUF1016 N-terminal domain
VYPIGVFTIFCLYVILSTSNELYAHDHAQKFGCRMIIISTHSTAELLMSQLTLEPEYQVFLTNIKQHYQKAQLKAAYAVNREMIQFYWQLGQMIIEKQA